MQNEYHYDAARRTEFCSKIYSIYCSLYICAYLLRAYQMQTFLTRDFFHLIHAMATRMSTSWFPSNLITRSFAPLLNRWKQFSAMVHANNHICFYACLFILLSQFYIYNNFERVCRMMTMRTMSEMQYFPILCQMSHAYCILENAGAFRKFNE